MTGTFGLRRRLRRAGRAVVYLAASLPLALLALLALVLLALGALASLAGGLGLPLLRAAVSVGRWEIHLDRTIANRLLDTQIAPLPAPAALARGAGRRREAIDLLTDPALRRIVVLLVVDPLISAVLLVAAFVPLVVLAGFLVFGFEALFGVGDLDYLGPWAFGPGVGVVLLLLALPTAVVALAVLDGISGVLTMVTRRLLAPRISPGAPVRELLAESLGDRTVAVAYWLPDRERFVDETGRPVELPDPASGRAWTVVERDGRPVAAIVHDASLDASRELVYAAATASSLAIDNERLKADLRARLEELRVSRLRIVEAADDARRRIERDLHDGAQQRLVALALDLRLLRTRAGEDGELVAGIDAVSERLSEALAELRELARGIHPSLLTERGLGPALNALASRAPLPVEVTIDVEGRLPAAIESAAYFTVAEGLTNVVKYAKAQEATVEVGHDGAGIEVLVADDGVGGVDLDAGSGLRGLQDRLAAVDGTLEIDSDATGTRLRARIPTELVA